MLEASGGAAGAGSPVAAELLDLFVGQADEKSDGVLPGAM
jgi:hypothetical protein